MKFTSTDKAPAALGPYSQAVSVNGLLFTSGQIALDPATGEIVGSDVQAQAEQVCKPGCSSGSKRSDIHRCCKNNMLPG